MTSLNMLNYDVAKYITSAKYKSHGVDMMVMSVEVKMTSSHTLDMTSAFSSVSVEYARIHRYSILSDVFLLFVFFVLYQPFLLISAQICQTFFSIFKYFHQVFYHPPCLSRHHPLTYCQPINQTTSLNKSN